MDYIVKCLDKNDMALIKDLSNIEAEAFGVGGLNEWVLVPLAKHGYVFALLDKERVIGSAQFMPSKKGKGTYYLMGISIKKEQRGKGLGTYFLTQCINHLKGEGIKIIELTVDPNNHPAVKVYKQKLGFVQTEFRRDEYGTNQHRLVLQLTV